MEDELFAELLQSVRDLKAAMRGDMAPSRVFEVEPSPDHGEIVGSFQNSIVRIQNPEIHTDVVSHRVLMPIRSIKPLFLTGRFYAYSVAMTSTDVQNDASVTSIKTIARALDSHTAINIEV